ncbi:MAG: hypothetical protein IPI73_30325 [Betaproteobacteria bacterium]|nr:hypothetical protein [Betaproteobacteria bacterium]
MLWRANLASGSIESPQYASTGLTSTFRLNSAGLAGNRLWLSGGDGRYIYGSVGVGPLEGFDRSLLAGYDPQSFSTVAPVRVETSFAGYYNETFNDVKVLLNGELLVLAHTFRTASGSLRRR